MRVNWCLIDPLILDNSSKMTCIDFCRLHNYSVPRTIGQRAKKLGVRFKKYEITQEHKNKTSNGIKKKFDKSIYEYISKNVNILSRNDIAKKLDISLFHVNRIIKELNIVIDKEFTRAICKKKSIEHVNKAAQAFRVKFKTDSDFRNKIIKNISENTKKSWKSDIYRLKVSGSLKKAREETDYCQKISEISKLRYETDPKVKEILFAERPFKTSKLNQTVATKLDGFGLEYVREFEIANYKFDFLIGNILLEVHGNYWHNLPENKKNDLAKATIIQKYYPQYQLKVIWESEIKSIRCNDRLLEVLNIQKKIPVIVDLDSLKFTSIIDKKDVDRFLISFHYLGTTNRKTFQFGMLLYNNLIAIATFGSLVRQNISIGKTIELTRLCRHPHFFNKNLMSNFLSKCIKHIKNLKKYDEIISYADLRLHSGTIYKATNWKDCGDTSPDYNYMSISNIPIHKKTLYNRAIAENLTENEYVIKYDYQKVPIGCKRKFSYDLSFDFKNS